MLQVAPDAILPPQVLLTWKLPVHVSDEIEIGTVPMLLSTTVFGALVVLISCTGKVTGALGEKLNLPVFSAVIAPSCGFDSTTSSFPSLLKSPITGKPPTPVS